MAIQQPKWAVYYGTIRLDDGTMATYNAAQVAAFYGVENETYLPVSLIGPTPFLSGPDEMSYYHLKPKSDPRLYFNAIDRYNVDNEIQWDDDFDAHRGGKWAVRPEFDNSEDV